MKDVTGWQPAVLFCCAHARRIGVDLKFGFGHLQPVRMTPCERNRNSWERQDKHA